MFDGGIGMSRRESIPNDDVTEPERDVESVAATLCEVTPGEKVKIGIAIDHPAEGRTGGTSVMLVWAVETDLEDFERRVSLLHHDGDVFRLYITGHGNASLDDWEIVSAPYEPETGIADLRDMAAHGWVVGAEVVETEHSGDSK